MAANRSAVGRIGTSGNVRVYSEQVPCECHHFRVQHKAVDQGGGLLKHTGECLSPSCDCAAFIEKGKA